jgi:hypothetical protein
MKICSPARGAVMVEFVMVLPLFLILLSIYFTFWFTFWNNAILKRQVLKILRICAQDLPPLKRQAAHEDYGGTMEKCIDVEVSEVIASTGRLFCQNVQHNKYIERMVEHSYPKINRIFLKLSCSVNTVFYDWGLASLTSSAQGGLSYIDYDVSPN